MRLIKSMLLTIVVFMISAYAASSADSAVDVFWESRDRLIKLFETRINNIKSQDVVYIDNGNKVMLFKDKKPYYEIKDADIWEKERTLGRLEKNNIEYCKKRIGFLTNKPKEYWLKTVVDPQYVDSISCFDIVFSTYKTIKDRNGSCVGKDLTKRWVDINHETFDLLLSMSNPYCDKVDTAIKWNRGVVYDIEKVVSRYLLKHMSYDYIKKRSKSIKPLLVKLAKETSSFIRAYSLCEMTEDEKRWIQCLRPESLLINPEYGFHDTTSEIYHKFKSKSERLRREILYLTIFESNPEIKDYNKKFSETDLFQDYCVVKNRDVKGYSELNFNNRYDFEYNLGDLLQRCSERVRGEVFSFLESYDFKLGIWVFVRAGLKSAEEELIRRYDRGAHIENVYKRCTVEPDSRKARRLSKQINEMKKHLKIENWWDKIKCTNRYSHMRDAKCHLKSDRVKKGVRPYSNGDIKNIARSGSKKAIRHMLEDFKNERQTYNDIRIEGRLVSTRRVIIEAMSRHHPFSKYFNVRLWKFLECGGVSGEMENIEDIKSHRDKIMDKCECCRFKNNKDYLKELAEFFKKEWNIEYERQNFGDYIITSSCLNEKQWRRLYVYSCRGHIEF